MDKTLFGRMIEAYGDGVSTLLSIQYRMNEIIMGWSSAEFYEGRLEAGDEVRHHTLAIEAAEDDDSGKPLLMNHPMLFVDTTGNPRFKEDEGGADRKGDSSSSKKGGIKANQAVSKSNRGEADLLLFYMRYLLIKHHPFTSIVIRLKNYDLVSCFFCFLEANGVDRKKTSITIITPYNGQVDCLRILLAENEIKDVPVNTVDSFQGCEADIVLLSLVRSNDAGEVGFLADFRRLNVAVTRARKHICIFGNSATICTDEVLGSLYGYALERGKVVFAGDVDPRADDFGEGEGFGGDSGPFEEKDAAEVKAGMDKAAAAQPKKKAPPQVQQQPVHISDADAEKLRVKFAAKIETWLKLGEQRFLDFPKNLNARERLIVHEICDAQGLPHESLGEGKKRWGRV